MTTRAAGPSPRAYARTAGIAYLVIVVTGALYGGLVESRLVVAEDHAATAENILANETLFRAGIVSVLVIYVSVVVASWALYVILRTVDRDLALLALLFRSAEAIVGAATVLTSFAVLHVLGVQGPPSALDAEQAEALAGRILEVRTAGLDVVLVFIGVGATVFCYLLFRSRLVPRALAAWGLFTYLSMLVLALVSILLPDHPQVLEIVLYSAGSLFELTLGLWLVFKGVDLRLWHDHA